MQIVHNYSCSTAAYFLRKNIRTRINVKMNDSCNILTTWQLKFEVLNCDILEGEEWNSRAAGWVNFGPIRE